MIDEGRAGAGIIGAVALAVALAAWPAGPALPAEPVTESEKPPTGVIDTGHAGASARVRALGAWVDRFFTDEEYEAELNESWMRVRLDGFAEEYAGLDVGARIRLYLKLPGLNERVRLEILSNAEDQEIEGSAGVGPPPADAVNDSVTAALSYFFSNKERRSVSARLGLKFDGITPNPFVGARYRERVPLGDDTNFRFVERVRFYTLDGLESRTSLQLEHTLEEDRLFRVSLDGTWLQEESFFYSLGFSVSQPLGEKSAIQYEISNGFMTSPHRLDQVTLRLRYRRQIWREWLTFEVAPQIAAPRSRDYQPVPGIYLRLEATFGG
jgi:hypothetical protein